jgi:hypothetical protein
MKSLIDSLLGGQEPHVFIANFIFAMLGVLLTLLASSTFRNVESERTPKQFSWKFFLSDNVKRILAGIILIYLALRFTQDIFGIQVSNWFAVVIGILHDSLAWIVKEKIKSYKLKTSDNA